MLKTKKILFSIGTITTTIIASLSVVSCSESNTNKETETNINNEIQKIGSIENQVVRTYGVTYSKQSSFSPDLILDNKSYNLLHDEMVAIPKTVAIAVIANGKVDTDIVKINKGESVMEALDSSKFIFKKYMTDGLGAFINSYALKSQPNVFMHGTNTEKNYDDYYPMYYINHKYAQLGVSNYHLEGHEMLEFSYDK